MSYQALYRVWRPQRFSDVVGQELVVTTLKNAIITNQISHAYLFAGPRGTGKTSAAKIFAKAVNCHHQVNGEPCNECETCQAITNGQLNDVIEIDAASNNGVEEIRDIRDKAKYAPTQADYKVYIIDEVHMLSTGAFNALLKTLEEPPANVIFILATTEPHKIPLTIISRVQRFDFRRISPQDAFNRMKFILDQKQLQYDEKALWVIANAAEGGMRDALSILDQVLSFSDNQVELKDALLVTGSVTKQLLKKYFLQVAAGKSAQALTTMGEILDQGKDGQRFIEDLISFIRDVLLYQESPELLHVEATGLTTEDFDELIKAADAQTLYSMIDTLNDIQEEMRFTTHPDVYLEVLTVRLSQQKAPTQANAKVDNQVVNQLQQEVVTLQKQIQDLLKRSTVPAMRRQQPVVQPKTTPQSHFRLNLEQVYQVLDHATKGDLTNLRDLWGDALSLLDSAQSSLIRMAKPVAASPSGVVVAYENAFLLEQAAGGSLAESLGKALEQVSGTHRTVAFVPSERWPKIRQDFLTSRGYYDKKAAVAPAEKPKTPADPIVAQAHRLFGTDGVKVEDN
ncbi:DNA polymerase III subunit gamma/tau [Lactobacillus sp. 3B(2020)]|uniref:DNA polymerase III subunit gamma/tau n=1 Tax=Lactobacillus sp. 3B(2020) TaxID=2695882 RepID=UPI0015DDC30F|nr:DNA polymerase III subunit gamma/tau [Lactobacillus sp. 3B(2020)]QLL70594.1 DNA polymerase III subunit gamma/tau [Lactobacillus sp. 3B(2020)]